MSQNQQKLDKGIWVIVVATLLLIGCPVALQPVFLGVRPRYSRRKAR